MLGLIYAVLIYAICNSQYVIAVIPFFHCSSVQFYCPMLPQFVLASASPGRRQLLIAAGIQPFVYPSRFDEDQIQLSNPSELVQALSKAKAESVAASFENAVVLGCDSVLAFQGVIYGKPKSRQEAVQRLQQMRGKEGELYTGHTLIAPRQTKTLVRVQVTRVFFAALCRSLYHRWQRQPICGKNRRVPYQCDWPEHAPVARNAQ
jgi:MAF protein